MIDTTLIPVLLGVLWLAWSNGANDNFKGVATLYGSGVLRYRAALALATAAVSGPEPCAAAAGHPRRKLPVRGGGVRADRRRITEPSHGQGLTANLVTAGLVLGASHLGLPVSTTHVATGAIFGIGIVNGRRDVRTIARILLTWVVTLPLGLVLGAGLYALGSPG